MSAGEDQRTEAYTGAHSSKLGFRMGTGYPSNEYPNISMSRLKCSAISWAVSSV